MRLWRIALRIAGEKPLSPDEKKELAKANVFVMDFEADGGTFPPDIYTLMNKSHLSPTEERRIIQWAKGLAPGNFWD